MLSMATRSPSDALKYSRSTYWLFNLNRGSLSDAALKAEYNRIRNVIRVRNARAAKQGLPQLIDPLPAWTKIKNEGERLAAFSDAALALTRRINTPAGRKLYYERTSETLAKHEYHVPPGDVETFGQLMGHLRERAIDELFDSERAAAISAHYLNRSDIKRERIAATVTRAFRSNKPLGRFM